MSSYINLRLQIIKNLNVNFFGEQQETKVYMTTLRKIKNFFISLQWSVSGLQDRKQGDLKQSL